MKYRAIDGEGVIFHSNNNFILKSTKLIISLLFCILMSDYYCKMYLSKDKIIGKYTIWSRQIFNHTLSSTLMKHVLKFI